MRDNVQDTRSELGHYAQAVRMASPCAQVHGSFLHIFSYFESLLCKIHVHSALNARSNASSDQHWTTRTTSQARGNVYRSVFVTIIYYVYSILLEHFRMAVTEN